METFGVFCTPKFFEVSFNFLASLINGNLIRQLKIPSKKLLTS